MDKIGLLTLDAHSYNYGGTLQQFALFTAICKIGYLCEIIDLNLQTELPMFSYRRNLKYLTIKKLIKRLKDRKRCYKYDAILEDVIKQRHFLFDTFRRDYITLSKRCDLNDLRRIQDLYIAVVCGSDQIWNPALARPSFFLNFVDESRNKVIYAASIGRESLSKTEKKVYKQYLKKLDYISVREEKAKAIIDDIRLCIDVSVVLDPTLLIETDKWRNIAGDVPLCSDSYIFCYYLELNERKKSAAINFATMHNMRIISIPYLHEKYNGLDDDFSTFNDPVGPSEFLNLILYAKYVLTDSFHASVFSILFNKRFRVFGRGSGREKMNSRIETLLGYIGHNDYLIDPMELNSCEIEKEETYDYSVLDEKTAHSINWLYKGLK